MTTDEICQKCANGVPHGHGGISVSTKNIKLNTDEMEEGKQLLKRLNNIKKSLRLKFGLPKDLAADIATYIGKREYKLLKAKATALAEKDDQYLEELNDKEGECIRLQWQLNELKIALEKQRERDKNYYIQVGYERCKNQMENRIANSTIFDLEQWQEELNLTPTKDESSTQ